MHILKNLTKINMKKTGTQIKMRQILQRHNIRNNQYFYDIITVYFVPISLLKRKNLFS